MKLKLKLSQLIELGQALMALGAIDRATGQRLFTFPPLMVLELSGILTRVRVYMEGYDEALKATQSALGQCEKEKRSRGEKEKGEHSTSNIQRSTSNEEMANEEVRRINGEWQAFLETEFEVELKQWEANDFAAEKNPFTLTQWAALAPLRGGEPDAGKDAAALRERMGEFKEKLGKTFNNQHSTPNNERNLVEVVGTAPEIHPDARMQNGET